MEDNEQGTTPNTDTSANTPAADPLKNLQAEMNRKMSNLEQANAQLLEQLKAMNQPKKAEAPKKVSVWEDEEAYARSIREQTVREVEEKLSKREQENARQQQTIAALMADFPELSQGDHQLTTRAVEIYNSLDEEDKRSPLAYRAAVKDAALELGIKPKSKRQTGSQDDAYTLGGSSSGKPAKKSGDLDNRTAEFAALMGVDISKPEVKERLLKKHGRKSYNSWE
jgi:rRNA maturation endonuclease Nob1